MGGPSSLRGCTWAGVGERMEATEPAIPRGAGRGIWKDRQGREGGSPVLQRAQGVGVSCLTLESAHFAGRQRAEGTLAFTELWAQDISLSIIAHHSPGRKALLG